MKGVYEGGGKGCKGIEKEVKKRRTRKKEVDELKIMNSWRNY